MLKYKTTGKERIDSNSINLTSRSCSFVSSQVGHSKSAVILKNVSFPLAWLAEEYFDNRGEWREFKVVLILRSNDGQEIVSDPLEKINRTFSDVKFSQTFIFNNVSSDFSIEALLCSQRTDENATPTVVQTVSRSLGKRLGTSLKRYIGSSNTINAQFFIEKDEKEEIPTNLQIHRQLTPIGKTVFRLKNASLSGLIRVYRLQTDWPGSTTKTMPRSALLPLFGNMCCQVFVQPMSLLQPLAQGGLDLYFIDDRLLLQKLSCVLQGGILRCYNPNSPAKAAEPSSINIPIDENTEIDLTGFQTALKITLNDPKEQAQKRLMVIASSQSSFLGWKEAMKLQVLDCQVWKEFASINKNAASIKSVAGLNLSLKNSISRYAQHFGTLPVVASDTRKFLQEQGFDLPIYRRSRRPLSTVFSRQLEKEKTLTEDSKKRRPESDVLPNTYVINLRIGLDNEDDKLLNEDVLNKISSTAQPAIIESKSESNSSRQSSSSSVSTNSNKSVQKMLKGDDKELQVFKKLDQSQTDIPYSSTLPIRTKIPPPLPPKPTITTQISKPYKPTVPPRRLPPSQSFSQPRNYLPPKARAYSNITDVTIVTRL